MKLPLVIIRPEPGASATAARARQAGWHVIAEPLFAVRALPWTFPADTEYDALLVGSGNALRHSGSALKNLAHLPVYAVGEKTAALAKQHGFAVAQSGGGGLAALLPALKTDQRQNILWLSGRDYVPLPNHDLTIARIETYVSAPLPMPDALATILDQGAVIALHSARAAVHFRTEALHAGLDPAKISLACFGPRIAEAAGTGWAAIGIAKSHDDEALLEVARQLCQT